MWILVLAALALALLLFHLGRTWLGWVLPAAGLLAGAWLLGASAWWVAPLALALLALAVVGGVRPVRRTLVTRRVLPLVAPILPRMSETEREAIEAGTVGWEGELFAGAPDWSRLAAIRPRPLDARELAFLDGPVEEVAAMVDDWRVQQANDLPPEVWAYLAEKGFFGMIVPERHGGLGFSAHAQSAVVAKLASRSVALAVTVMVPNSLGPAELLLHYGTDEQQRHWLPRLARGEEIPAFALTEPMAGSDAGAMQSHGVVCEGSWRGKRTLGMRLTWDKRYITLAPAATVLGLAFKLRDPDGLLGGEAELGITCALIPTDTPGVETGERHDPLGVPFLNGPTRGTDVFVPLDFVIGGRAMAGKGWRMLMQSLAAGRGISLPSMAVGAAAVATRAAGAYATVREQFGLPIGRFEGVAERLARIAGLTYAMDATRRLAAASVDAGEKPSVLSAIAKCWLTEGMRVAVNDAMDVFGGAGICQGPRNVLAGAYAALPIGITVEGANILTRSMIVFGQGAIRCHPFVQDEMQGAEERDLVRFDRAFFGHVGFVFRNAARSLVLGLSDGRLARAPVVGPTAGYYRRLARASASFALVSDAAMGTLGGALKRRESLTGRLADALAWMTLGSAALERFRAEGAPAVDLPYVRWSVEHALYEVQQALCGVLRNLPARPAAWVLRALVFPLGARWAPPSDRVAGAAAAGILEGGEARERLSAGIFLSARREPGLATLEDALAKVLRARPIERALHDAERDGRLAREPRATRGERARAAGLIDAPALALLAEAEAARRDAVAVDSFPPNRSKAVRA